MATLRLEYVTHQAITTSFILRISKVEAPKDRHLAWISRHGLNERPNHHEEKKMEDAKEVYDVVVVLGFRQPAKEHVGVVNYANHPGTEDDKDVTDDGLGAHG